AGPAKGAVGGRDARLGAHARRARAQRDRRPGREGHAARAAEVPVRHRQGVQGGGREPGLMLDLLGSFVGELRDAGIPVSTTEHLDAARALVAIDLMERSVMKAALSTTLVKDETHFAAFDLAFEIFFASVSAQAAANQLEEPEHEAGEPSSQRGAEGQGKGGGGGASGEVPAEEPAPMLFRPLRGGD